MERTKAVLIRLTTDEHKSIMDCAKNVRRSIRAYFLSLHDKFNKGKKNG
jgi:hypothetical protein